MSENPLMREAIQEAIQLAKEGRKAEARDIIDGLVTDDPDNAAAWFVLAQLVEDRGQAIRCLRRVVYLEPSNKRARAYLEKLEAKAAGKTPGKSGKSQGLADSLISSADRLMQSEPLQRYKWLIGLGAALVVICVLGLIAAQFLRPASPASTSAGGSMGGESAAMAVEPTLTPTGAAPADEPTPLPTATPDAELIAMRDLVGATPVNPMDLISIMQRFKLVDQPLQRALDSAPGYTTGSVDSFVVLGWFGLEEVDAVLVYQNDVVNMWVEDGLDVPQSDIAQAADTFANEIYPTVHDVFGQEWSPGVDQDTRLNILTVWSLGPNIGGYFFFPDEYPREVFDFSNQREIFYMSYGGLDGVGSDYYMSALAHEFQHMVQWNQDPNEDIWLNEGLSQVAERIMGYDTAFTHYNYLYDSRVQLNSWSKDFRASYSNYGAGYLYLLYIWERFGVDAIRAIAQQPAGGFDAVNAALAPYGATADDVFGDWIVANYVNDPGVGDGLYGYQTEDLIPICPRTRLAQSGAVAPVTTLPQYTANYIEIEGRGEFNINFQGDTEVGLISANAYSGTSVWWSNHADNSDMTLTRAFDLREPQEAMLQFWTWYEIEEGDAGIVTISTDGGQTWEFLQSPNMTRTELDDYIAYRGASGGGSHGLWVNESVDLSAYVGQEVLIRFEYLTDGKVTGLGWAIDNIRVPELSYNYDVEQAEDGWQADGFMRVANRVPQNWAVSLVTYEGSTQVQRLAVDGYGRAAATVTLTDDIPRATLIIGAMAPATGVPATYHLSLGGDGVMDSLRNPPGVQLQDDFESPCSTFESFVLPDYSRGYQNGRYEMRIDIEDTVIYSPAEQDFTDAVIDVDTVQFEPAPDSTTGLMCRIADDYNYYGFDIRNDGTYSVYAVVDGEFLPLQDWTASEAIQTGSDAFNHLQMSCVDDRITVAANGTRLASFQERSLHRGDIAFTIGTFDQGGIWVAFDNLVVTNPSR